MRVLGAVVIGGPDRQPRCGVPVARRPAGEGQGSGSGVPPGVGGRQGDRLDAGGVEGQLDHHGDPGTRVAGQLDEDLVVLPGVGAAGQRIVAAFDHHGTGVLDGGTRDDFSHPQPRGVVVANRDFNVGHRQAVVRGVCRLHAVLHDDHPVALGTGVVWCIHVHQLGGGVIVGSEREDQRLAGDRSQDAVEVNESLEVAGRGATGTRGGGAQPDRVAQPGGQLLRDVCQVDAGGVSGLLLRGRGCRGCDIDVGGWLAGQPNSVGIDGATLGHPGAIGLFDDHQTAAADHAGCQTARSQPVVTGVAGRRDQVVHRAGDTFEFADDDVLDDVACHVDGVAAQAADDSVGDTVCGGLHEELIVALKPVNLDEFHRGEPQVDAGAADRVCGDHDVVGELGAEDHHLVDSGTTVDGNGGVDVVLDLVGPAAGTDVQRLAGGHSDDRPGLAIRIQRDQVVCPGVGPGARSVAGAVAVGVVTGLGEREGAHHEQVGVVVALKPQRGLVGVDGVGVVAGAAGGHQRGVRARAQPAAGGRDQTREQVLCCHSTGRGVALGTEDLADLEVVEPGTAVQGDRRGGVVDVEVVVAGQTVHRQSAVECGVVVDPLHRGGGFVAGDQVGVGGDRAVQQRHKGGTVSGFVATFAGLAAAGRDTGGGPEQEDVVTGGRGGSRGQVAGQRGVEIVDTIDGCDVGAIVRRPGVQQVDDIVADAAGRGARTGGVYGVGVGAGLAVEGEGVACRHVHGLQVVDDHPVLAAGRVHPRLRTEVDVAVAAQSVRHADAQFVSERDGVGVGFAVDVGQVRRLVGTVHQVPGGDVAAEDHGRAVVLVEVAPVAMNVDVVGGPDQAVGIGADVVADPQLHVARGLCDQSVGKDHPVGNGARRVRTGLREPHRAALYEIEVLIGGRGLAHGQTDVAVPGLREHQAQVGRGLGHEDRIGRLQTDVGAGEQAADRRVDLEVVESARVTDAAAVGGQIDGPATDVPGIIAGPTVAGVQNRAVGGAQPDVGDGVHGVDLQVADGLVEEDALGPAGVTGCGVEGAQDAGQGAVQGVDIDLEPVAQGADAAQDAGLARVHRDVHAGHVRLDAGAGVVEGVHDHGR